MPKKPDDDLLALKGAKKALLKSTSRRMLITNIEFLVDYFINNPSKELPEYLRSNKERAVSNPGNDDVAPGG